MMEQHFIHNIAVAIIEIIQGFYAPMGGWLLFAVGLTITNSRFYVKANETRKDNIHTPRRWRRSLNIFFDYFCWVTLAVLCEQTIDITIKTPIISRSLLLIVYGIELNSCFNNYFKYKGMGKKFNFLKLIKSPDISGMLEDTDERIKGDKS